MQEFAAELTMSPQELAASASAAQGEARVTPEPARTGPRQHGHDHAHPGVRQGRAGLGDDAGRRALPSSDEARSFRSTGALASPSMWWSTGA